MERTEVARSKSLDIDAVFADKEIDKRMLGSASVEDPDRMKASRRRSRRSSRSDDVKKDTSKEEDTLEASSSFDCKVQQARDKLRSESRQRAASMRERPASLLDAPLGRSRSVSMNRHSERGSSKSGNGAPLSRHTERGDRHRSSRSSRAREDFNSLKANRSPTRVSRHRSSSPSQMKALASPPNRLQRSRSSSPGANGMLKAPSTPSRRGRRKLSRPISPTKSSKSPIKLRSPKKSPKQGLRRIESKAPTRTDSEDDKGEATRRNSLLQFDPSQLAGLTLVDRDSTEAVEVAEGEIIVEITKKTEEQSDSDDEESRQTGYLDSLAAQFKPDSSLASLNASTSTFNDSFSSRYTSEAEGGDISDYPESDRKHRRRKKKSRKKRDDKSEKRGDDKNEKKSSRKKSSKKTSCSGNARDKRAERHSSTASENKSSDTETETETEANSKVLRRRRNRRRSSIASRTTATRSGSISNASFNPGASKRGSLLGDIVTPYDDMLSEFETETEVETDREEVGRRHRRSKIVPFDTSELNGMKATGSNTDKVSSEFEKMQDAVSAMEESDAEKKSSKPKGLGMIGRYFNRRKERGTEGESDVESVSSRRSKLFGGGRNMNQHSMLLDHDSSFSHDSDILN